MVETIKKYLGYFLIGLMLIMTVDVLWGVFTRYVLGNQATWTEELAKFLLIWIGILGAAYAAGKRMHLSIDLLKPKLAPSGKRKLEWLIAFLIMLFACCVMLIGGGRLMYIQNVLGQTSPALNIPFWLVYSVLPISGLLILIFKIDELNKPAWK